jgi:hypothetical protein
MSEAVQATATTASAPAAPDPMTDPAIAAMLGTADARGNIRAAAPAAAPAPAAQAKPGAPAKAEGGDEGNPLDESLYSEEALNTPEKVKEARERLFKHLGKVNELQRKANRAHGAASAREARIQKAEAGLQEREARAAAFERMAAGAVADLESGDAERFLTAVGKLSKSGDPASFWRNASLALVKGEKLKPTEQKAVDADPELKRRLEVLERGIVAKQEREETDQLESLKSQHLQTAQSSDQFPYVKAWANENPEIARESIVQVMTEEWTERAKAAGVLKDPSSWHTVKPVDISTACGIIERTLKSQFELFQRADSTKSGQNGEKGTTGPEPDAGRETSKEPPKPEVAKAQTVPVSLASSPGSATRSETAEERRARQIRELEDAGWI